MHKKIYILITAVLILLVSCTSSNQGDNNITDAPEATITPSASPTSPTPELTAEPTPTSTPTVAPTATPTPSPTPTPIPVLSDLLSDTERNDLYDIPMEPFNFVTTYDSVYVYSAKDCLIAIYPDYYSKDYVGAYQESEFSQNPDDSFEGDDPYYYDIDQEYDDTKFICELKNLLTGETKMIDFSFEASFSPYAYIEIINDTTFAICDGEGREFLMYNTELEFLGMLVLGDGDSGLYYNYFFDPNTAELYYILPGSDTLYKKSLELPEGKKVLKNEVFKELYSYSMLTDNIVVSHKYDYSGETGKCYFFDLKNKASDSIPYESEELIISDDGTEILVNHRNENYFELYDINKSPFPILNSKYNPDKKYKPKASYNLGDDIESWNVSKFDWNNRLIIVSDGTSQGPTTDMSYTSYRIDDGSLFSLFNYRYDIDYFWDQSVICPDDGLLLIPSGIDTPIYQAWDYTKEGDNTDSSLYVRTNFIPPEIDAKRKAMEEKYNIYFYLGPEIGSVVSDYIVTVSYDYTAMSNALDTIDETLSIYPDGFLNQIKVGPIKTLGIYLCEGFTKNGPNSIDTAIAVATSYGYERLLILDINYAGDDLAQNLVHEISHWIDKRLNYKLDEDEYDELWCELNPKDFKYCFSYVDCSYNWKYIFSTYSLDNSYFTDSYSQTYPTEDRARLFEYLVYPSYYEDYYQSEHIREKMAKYCELIRENFDTTGWPEQTVWERKLNDYNELYGSGSSEDIKLPEVNEDAA